MVETTILGFPRMGVQRSLKTALEKFWSGQCSGDALLSEAAHLRRVHWQSQKETGLTLLPSNDFSLYDHMLDMSALFGVVPERYRWTGDTVDLDTYFAMARGFQKDAIDVRAAEMTKWFDTNYHYIVPEFAEEQTFRLASSHPTEAFLEAKGQGIMTRPVLVGPLTYLRLGKGQQPGNLNLLPQLLGAYQTLLAELQEAGATWVQFDEPILVMDLDAETRQAFIEAYAQLRRSTSLKIMVASYFGALGDNIDTALHLQIDALHVDLTRGRDQLPALLDKKPSELILSLGIVDGRNVWRNSLGESLRLLEQTATRVGLDKMWVASSCSLMFTPYDLALETDLDEELKSWLAFGQQKMEELVVLARGLEKGRDAIAPELAASDRQVESRQQSRRTHNAQVYTRLREHPLSSAGRKESYSERHPAQAARLQLPLFPTTTIGSFPQTPDVRRARAAYRKGHMTQEAYDVFLKEQIRQTITFQNDVGLDVLVHGEFERTDMVEYFGEQLDGFAITQQGWVQSYGSRCVKPPIIYGDVVRSHPITVPWSRYAQSLTTKPVKGMLTGPVTILQWSFVRDDQPRSVTAQQIALALQDEVLDLENAGLRIIQIDEPAFREGLPLRRSEWTSYLTWAAQAFRLAATGVRPDTQIHTHMCYAEFDDILEWIQELDADVISIETSRSHMELLESFTDVKYPYEIGPGVYDIHSPRVPSQEEIQDLLEAATQRFDEKKIWVNPDCGLKTRGWGETKAALRNMVGAAAMLRARRSLRRA